ncbi:MAG: polyprenyl synthetase family protein [Fimbriimonadaceae bacterium]|nr:polyprenyl synthetase family protein [Fimbriimonadaceae bacterium]QYK56907.1 MAG: polyprenyl synthetase family protein [Fimbriimonadaceae bacterium]
MLLTEPWAEVVATVDARLGTLLPPEDTSPSRLHRAMRYAVLGGGKRLRPAMCLAAAVAAGGEAVSALDAACAIEFTHCFSLVHDDLPALDDDDLRRGRPTVHRAFDEATAVLAGDALFALAFRTLAESTAPPSALAELARATGSDGLVGGETLDLEAEGQETTLEALREIHQKKTGALIACACAVGGLCAGAPEGVVACLREFGATVGLAFQIIDDVLNETATTEQLGKAGGSDRERSKATYPAKIGVEASRLEAHTLLAHAVSGLQDAPGDPTLLIEIATRCVDRTS